MKGCVLTMTLQEAKKLMTPEAIDNLKGCVEDTPTVNIGNKITSDILMQALCRSVTNGVIKESSLDEKTIKILNSTTATISEDKFRHILSHIRTKQNNIVCVISLLTGDMSETIREWVMDGTDSTSLMDIYDYVVDHFKITPSIVRKKLQHTLKLTIVNNIAQFVSKCELAKCKKDIKISITTISRLVNMESCLLFAEFKELI